MLKRLILAATLIWVAAPFCDSAEFLKARQAYSKLDSRLMRSTVRLWIRQKDYTSVMSGTIIDHTDDQLTILTCAHGFREETFKTEAHVFDVKDGYSRVIETVPVKAIYMNKEADLSILRGKYTGPAEIAKIYSQRRYKLDTDVIGVGCEQGAEPQIREGKLLSCYPQNNIGNLQCTNISVPGSSGSGLFNTDGQLIGVRWGRDVHTQEGLCVSLTPIHNALHRVKLSRLIEKSVLLSK